MSRCSQCSGPHKTFERPECAERQRAYLRAYRQRPEVKERQRAYIQRPEIRARRNQQQNERNDLRRDYERTLEKR